MYLDFLSAIVSQNRLNPIMRRAKNDRSVLRALPVYDNDRKRDNTTDKDKVGNVLGVQSTKYA